MRPRIPLPCSSACSWVIFSFFTRPPSCACVTCWAFSRPWSTNFCSTSFSTTSRPAAAMTCAISPPIVPAPTTAALNTYIGPPKASLGFRRLQRGLLRRLAREAPARADERVAQGAPDEEEVRDRGEDARARELVLEVEAEPGAAARDRLEAGRQGATEAVIENMRLEPAPRLSLGNIL